MWKSARTRPELLVPLKLAVFGTPEAELTVGRRQQERVFGPAQKLLSAVPRPGV